MVPAGSLFIYTSLLSNRKEESTKTESERNESTCQKRGTDKSETWLFMKINKIAKFLARLVTKKKNKEHRGGLKVWKYCVQL